jgi:hypothetical protein
LSEKIVVFDPTGYPPKVRGKALAPRLDTLTGKTMVAALAGDGRCAPE